MPHPRERRSLVISEAVIETCVDFRYVCVDDLKREILLVLEVMVKGAFRSPGRREQGLGMPKLL